MVSPWLALVNNAVTGDCEEAPFLSELSLDWATGFLLHTWRNTTLVVSAVDRRLLQ